MQNVGVGLVGYGLAGSVFHAPLISSTEGFTLKKIASSRQQNVIDDYPDVEVVATIDELLKDEEIELIVIGSPNTTHFPFTKQALLANKHVVVDKPFTNTVQEADELIKLAHDHNRLLSVFQNRRWDNDFLTIKKCIQEGILGDLFSYEAHYDRFRPEVKDRWREQNLPGSGMLFDLGSHLIDQTIHLFGMPKTIYADLHSQRAGSPIVDYFHLLLGYEGNLRAILHSGSVVRKPGPHFMLHGTKGSFIKYGLDPQEDDLRSGLRPGDPGWGTEPAELFGELTIDTGGLAINGKIETLKGSYESYYAQLWQAIREGKSLPVDPQDARSTIQVIERAIQSSAEKRELSLD